MNAGVKFENVAQMKITVVLSGTIGEFNIIKENLGKTYLGPVNVFEAAIDKCYCTG
jgi:hypothetical protein